MEIDVDLDFITSLKGRLVRDIHLVFINMKSLKGQSRRDMIFIVRPLRYSLLSHRDKIGFNRSTRLKMMKGEMIMKIGQMPEFQNCKSLERTEEGQRKGESEKVRPETGDGSRKTEVGR